MHEQSHVTVIGGGTMGAGIALTTLLHTSATVSLVETQTTHHQRLATAITSELHNRDQAEAAPRLLVVGELAATPLADLIVEAIPEIPSLKEAVLREAETRLRDGGLLASNTSSLSITGLAAAVTRPEQFLGMHFFQPVPDTTLTELIIHPRVSEETVAAAHRWTTALGREAITAADAPGFATSRLGLAIGLEAMRMVEEGVASPEDIDRGMQLGYQHAVGPLRMTDMVGLDVRLAISEHLAATLGDRFAPPKILRDKVAAGELGRKSGRGFFTWD